MPLNEATREILSALKSFLEQADAEKYRQPVAILSGSTIGEHARHTVEFFQCLIEQSPSGTVNYDKRHRNRLMQENPQEALKALNTVMEALKAQEADKPLLLSVSFSRQADDSRLIHTSFQREWTYALEHAIHHLAIIKIGVQSVMPEVTLPEHFGVAPSTIKHRNRQCAQ